MDLSNFRALRGPNIWSQKAVCEAVLRLPRSSPIEFRAHLAELLSPLQKFCSEVMIAAQAFEFTAEPDHLANTVGHLALALEIAGVARVSLCRVLPIPETSGYRIVFEIENEHHARRCLESAVDICAAALAKTDFDLPARVKELDQLSEDAWVGFTHAMERAARKRGIPVRSLNQGSLFQLGHGIHVRRTWGAATDRTSSVAEAISWDKALAKQVLRDAGVPVPAGRAVQDAEDAWQAACELHCEVVIKPRKACHGRGVSIGLTSREQILAAYQAAREESAGVLVETCLSGAEHRLLVVNGRMVAASRGDALHITGDGCRTIIDLIDELNRNPRRAPVDDAPLYPIELDDIVRATLARQAYEPDSVPSATTRVLIQRNGNQSVDVTDEVHPANAAIAVMSARAIGLDVAGVDIVAQEISRPLREQGGAVLEVNSMPGLMMHLEPAIGQPRRVNEHILEWVFPPGETGRIPILITDAGSVQALQLGSLLESTGLKVGVACDAGTFLNGENAYTVDILSHPQLEAVVFEASLASILSDGLAHEYCHVAVLSAHSQDENAPAARRVLLGAVEPEGAAIVDAGLPNAASLVSACRGEVILYAADANHSALTAHRAAGHRVAYLRDGLVVVARGRDEEIVTPPAHVSADSATALIALWALRRQRI